MPEAEGYEGWALLELMGHRKLAGKVSEQVIAGAALLRIDVPTGPETSVTQFYGGSAIYCITPTTEEIARKVAVHYQPQPVTPWELRAPDVGRILPEPVDYADDPDDDDEDGPF